MKDPEEEIMQVGRSTQRRGMIEAPLLKPKPLWACLPTNCCVRRKREARDHFQPRCRGRARTQIICDSSDVLVYRLVSGPIMLGKDNDTKMQICLAYFL